MKKGAFQFKTVEQPVGNLVGAEVHDSEGKTLGDGAQALTIRRYCVVATRLLSKAYARDGNARPAGNDACACVAKQLADADMNFVWNRLTLACGFALTLVGATAVHAASRDEEEHACRGDALRLCMADVPDKARITDCMKQHYDQLSPPCKAMFDAPNARSRSKGTAPASGGQ